MGLGLAICRLIVERHRGQFTAASDGKSGALFQFVLPVVRVDQTAPAPKASSLQGSGQAPGTPASIARSRA